MDFTTISFQSVAAKWMQGSHIPLLENSCHIWDINVSETKPYLESLEAMLSDEEAVKARKFHFQKDTENYIVRRAYLRLFLSKYIGTKAESIVFTSGQNKRPIVDVQHKSSPKFNLSHTDNRVLIAFSYQELGVDIEKVNPDFHYSEILEHYFTEEEINHITQAIVPLKAFYTLWTRKEAILKACSKGIIADLAAIQCVHENELIRSDLISSPWYVTSFDIDEQYTGSVALPTNAAPLFFKASLPELLNH
ncbi:MAG: 4'-phosphopantetheinyl transferase superfamily protein [Bacteroidota bacterium]